MILSNESFFRNPPYNLDSSQVVIFSAIRYSIDVCDIAFERLKLNLHNYALSEGEPEQSFPLLYSDVWIIIQNLSMFIKIVTTHYNISLADPLFDSLRDVIDIRNTGQHLDERIYEILATRDLPVYGSLSWYVRKGLDSNKGILTFLYSGTVTDKKEVINNLENKGCNFGPELISNIEFTGVIKPKRKEEVYENKTIVIDHLIDKVRNVLSYFDEQFTEQFKSFELPDRHVSDLSVKLDVTIVDNKYDS